MTSPLGGLPRLPMQHDEDHFTPPWAGWFAQAQIILTAASSSGTTAQRPTQNLYLGYTWFDTTLGLPIWVRSLGPTVWITAAGAVV